MGLFFSIRKRELQETNSTNLDECYEHRAFRNTTLQHNPRNREPETEKRIAQEKVTDPG